MCSLHAYSFDKSLLNRNRTMIHVLFSKDINKDQKHHKAFSYFFLLWIRKIAQFQIIHMSHAANTYMEKIN